MNPRFSEHKQHTIASEVSISGSGLHSGIHATLNLKPARPGFGFRFQRIDLPGQPIIAADCDLVSDTFRCTTLSDLGASVGTVEHILAALVGSGIDNCLIEVSGPEVPIIDGSCEPFVRLIEQAGLSEQEAPKIWYQIDEEISHYYAEKNVTMAAIPHEVYSIGTHVDFRGNVLDDQHANRRSKLFKNPPSFKEKFRMLNFFCNLSISASDTGLSIISMAFLTISPFKRFLSMSISNSSTKQ